MIRRLLRRPLVLLTVALAVVAAGFTAAFGAGFTSESSAYAGTEHTITFVNQSNETVWVGSGVNADGSVNFTQLPILEPGASATLAIPEQSGPGYWRGRFFGRQRCGGEGSSFHCLVGNCGDAVDHCVQNSNEPASLAEFNFDPNDAGGAPWYDVSYVDAVSLPITITPTGAPPPPEGSLYCAEAGCAKPLLDSCPAGNLLPDDGGQPLVCVNPNRDAETEYSKALDAACPRAYSWSKGDAVPGNQTMYSCKECSGFTVTFHGSGAVPPAPAAPPPPAAPPAPAEPQAAAVPPAAAEPPAAAVPPAAVVRIPGQAAVSGSESMIVSDWHGKCLDVPGGEFSDRVRLIVWDCWNGPMQRFEFAGDGTVRIGGKCLQVADGSTAVMAAIEVFTCNGTSAQQFVLSEAGDLVNPQADKCVDVAAWNGANGAPLQLWTCNGFANQKWHRA